MKDTMQKIIDRINPHDAELSEDIGVVNADIINYKDMQVIIFDNRDIEFLKEEFDMLWLRYKSYLEKNDLDDYEDRDFILANYNNEYLDERVDGQIAFIDFEEFATRKIVENHTEKMFPDPTFRAWVKENIVDKDIAFWDVKEIDVFNVDCKSLDGIQYFSELEALYCHESLSDTTFGGSLAPIEELDFEIITSTTSPAGKRQETPSPAAAKDNAIRASTQQSSSNRSVQKAR